MDDKQKARVIAIGIAADAANKAIIRLFTTLHAKGIFSDEEVEAFRHLHLRSFDAAIGHMRHEGVRSALEDQHEELDRLWEALRQQRDE